MSVAAPPETYAIVNEYRQRGFFPVPVERGSKSPSLGDDWNLKALHATDEDYEAWFRGKPMNIGLLLGPEAGGLVDVDLDRDIARRIAHRFLPETSAYYGRKSAPGSHRLYFCENAPAKTKQYQDAEHKMIVELRSGLQQSMAPGSVHPNGEAIAWHDHGEPERVDAETLRKACGMIAAVAVLVDAWPKASRHVASLAFAGAMLRSGVSQKDAEDMMAAIADETNAEDPEVKDNNVRGTYDKGPDAETYGWPKLIELIGEKPAKLVQKHLGIKAGKEKTQRKLNVVAGVDVECKSVSWFWPQRMPTGINLLLGMPDVGKSTLAANLASRVTLGQEWPTGDGYAPQGGVVWCAGESDLSMEVAPRLRANGTDMSKVRFVRGAYRIGESGEKVAEEYEDAVDLGTDVPALRSVAESIDAKLIVFDPLDAFIGAKVDIFQGPQIRRMLAPLKAWCEDSGITAVIIHHPRKAKSDHAIDAVSGGRSFGALPRSVWVAGWLGQTRYFAPVKTNLSREKPAAIEYATGNVPEYGAPLIRWSRECPEVTAEIILGGQTKSPAKDEAIGFLRDVIGNGAMWADDLKAEAEAAGIGWGSVRRAKADAGIETRQIAEPRQGWIYRRVGSDAVPPNPCVIGSTNATDAGDASGSSGPSDPETPLPFESSDPDDPDAHVKGGAA